MEPIKLTWDNIIIQDNLRLIDIISIYPDVYLSLISQGCRNDARIWFGGSAISASHEEDENIYIRLRLDIKF